MTLPLPFVITEPFDPEAIQGNFDELKKQFPFSARHVKSEQPHNVGASGEPAFQNSWVNLGGVEQVARFWKDPMKIVHIQGLIASGTLAVAAFTLPAGYRPGLKLIFASIANNAFARITILANGDVIPQTGSNVWFSLNCQFKQEQ